MLEGIGLIEKRSKNSIQWLGGGPRCNTREVTDRLLSLKEELIELDFKEMELNQNLTWSRQSLVNMMDDQVQKGFKYCYVTHDQLRTLAPNHNMMVIQSPPGSTLDIEAVKKSDLIRYGEAIENMDSLSKRKLPIDQEDELERLLFLDPTAIEFNKSMNKIKLLRQRGRCNRIHLKSEKGPAHVYLLNNDLDPPSDDAMSDGAESPLPRYKRQKYDNLKRIIETQKQEMESALALAAEQLKNVEITAIAESESQESESQTPVEPELVVAEAKPKQTAKTEVENGKPKPSSGSSRKSATSHAIILPSRHLSPRRAAQHHLFVPTSRTKDRAESEGGNCASRARKERKPSNECESVLASVASPVPLEQPIKEESTDHSSQSSASSTPDLPLPPPPPSIEPIAIKTEILDENSQEVSLCKSVASPGKKEPEMIESQPDVCTLNERSPLSEMQIKLDIDDLIIPDICLPFLRLSPPASIHDYHFNLTNDEGICDLFF